MINGLQVNGIWGKKLNVMFNKSKKSELFVICYSKEKEYNLCSVYCINNV